MENKDLLRYVPLSSAVSAAAMDMHVEVANVERRYQYFAARCIRKLTEETFKTGKRRAIIYVNKALNSATIDCDFLEEIFVGEIDPITGEKIPFHRNPGIIDTANIEEIKDDIVCKEHCEGCYSKALCNDLQTTQTINIIPIDTVNYNETITRTLQPDGTYYSITETPYYNSVTGVVEYLTKKEILTTLDLAACGCVVASPANTSAIQATNYDCYCTYCSPVCQRRKAEAGYRIFTDTQTIKFDHHFTGDKFYFEWRGSIPKRNGEYVIPVIAFETVVEYIKHKETWNKKSIPRWERQDNFQSYVRERSNMDKARFKFSLHDIVYALTSTPTFDYHV